MHRRSLRAALALGVLTTALTGCSGGSTGAADCSAQIRLGEVVYTGASATERPVATRVGRAEVADCDDNGPDAAGAFFSDDPERVAVWSFAGYSSDEVVGARFDPTSFTVFVADSVSDSRRDRILDELGSP